jgi:hypothetical protein
MLDEDYITAQEAAECLSSSENSLRTMRSKGYGPPFHKIGSAIFYRRSELATYVGSLRPSSQTRRSVKEAQKKRAAPGSTPARP